MRLCKWGIEKKCEKCGDIFYCRKDKKDRARFCSRSCLCSFISKNHQNKIHDEWDNEPRDKTMLAMRYTFETFFEKSDGCWNWLGSKKSKHPYGCFVFRGKYFIAHRASYEIYRGLIPEKKIVMHTCDNPPCVNPDHLKIGTHLDNQIDKVDKGRGKVEKLTKEQVIEIKKMLNVAQKRISGTSHIAKKFGVSRTTIHSINVGKTWSWLKI